MSSLNLVGQSVSPINTIRKRFQLIREDIKNEEYHVASQSYKSEGEPFGGKVIYHEHEAVPRMISHQIYAGDHSYKTVEYYSWEGKLFFVYVKEGAWRFDHENLGEGGIVQYTIDEILEFRFYYHQEKAIRCLEKQYQILTARDDEPAPDEVPNQTSGLRVG